MKASRFVFIRLSLYLLAGILLGFHYTVDLYTSITICSTVLLLFIAAFYRSRRLIFPDLLFGIITFAFIGSIGFTLVQLKKPANIPNHYLQVDSVPGLILIAEVLEELKPNDYQKRFIIETLEIRDSLATQKVSGKLLLNYRPDPEAINSLKAGDQILLPYTPEDIKPPASPFGFNYKQYLENLKIYSQMHVDASEVKVFSHRLSMNSYARALRGRLISDIQNYSFGKDELAVFQALILGQRSDINNELYKDYAAAGAVHILAISGLHIGILLMMFNWILRPLARLKKGRLLSLVIILGLLWAFALLTGLQASVIRAVTMYSFLAVGLQMRRKTGAFHSLSLSLFFLILIDPFYILQVGFQLSYLAVFSILLLQPKLYRLINFNFKVGDYLWKLASVSIAAQVGVMPLSIYYFHQFPALFLLTNIFILPFLGIILITGIMTLILAHLEILPEILVTIFNELLMAMNWIVTKIASIKDLVISNIQLDSWQTLALYLLFAALFITWQYRGFKNIIYTGVCIVVLQLSFLRESIFMPDMEVMILHQYRSSAITFKNGNRLTVATRDSLVPGVVDYMRARNIHETSKIDLTHAYDTPQGLLYIQDDHVGIPELHTLPEIILLRDSPKVNLERLIENAKPKQIVADASNYPYLIEKWKTTAQKQKIPFHATAEKGAFIIN